MRLNKSAPVGILPLMQVQVMPRTPCAHCQHEAGSLLLQVILYFLGQESLLPKLQDKVVIFFDPGTSPASTTSATDRPCTSRLCNTRFFLTLLVCKVTCRSLTRARFDIQEQGGCTRSKPHDQISIRFYRGCMQTDFACLMSQHQWTGPTRSVCTKQSVILLRSSC